MPAGDVGEIGTRGALLMLGYFDNQAATEDSFNRDGWFMSGDLGTLDERGCLRIVGRKKDLIIRGGHNIHPARIEDLAHRHPAVLKAAAFGVADERLGEKVCLAIICREGERVCGRGAARPSARGGPLEVRHAGVLHRDGRVSAYRERQDPEARAAGVGRERADRAAGGALGETGRSNDMAIELTRVEEFALIRLNRPEALNALSFALVRDLARAIDEVAASDARALLVTGAGDEGLLRRRRHRGAHATAR